MPNSFDFDRVIDRRHGDSLKWNKYAGRDVLPLWVADMDFAAPPAIIAALERRLTQGCFGYAEPWPALIDSVLGYLQREYAWRVEPEWLVWLPGLVCGINVACRAIDGGVLTATPVYPPFLSAPRLCGRDLVQVPLRLCDGHWGWDFAALEAAVTPATRLVLLCHPHNPVGRAWTAGELAEVAAFCKRHELFVCSDEIHCGLMLDADRRHQPLPLVDAETASRCITLMAPSKTYNIPGLGCAFAVISEPALRSRFRTAMRGIVPDVNVLGLAAAQAAYEDCEEWRQTLIAVLRGNRDRVQEVVGALPGLAMTRVEATYLAWIDARGLGLADPVQFFLDAGVGLSDGSDFGMPGWVRLNFGCPRATLDAALERMRAACSTLSSSAGAHRG